MTSARVVVVGLGPAGADLVLPAAHAAFERVAVRFARTARHPAVEELERQGTTFEPLDRLYDEGDDLDAVYSAIASYVVDAAHTHGEVVYAVPGSPNVAERTVLLLRAANVEVEIVPGVSFADLAWARLGIDPLGGVRVVDARAFGVDAAGLAGPMLIAQADTRFVLSDVKLALLEVVPPDHPVTVLQRLGLPDEHVVELALEDLDRNVEPDHLTSVFVDTGELAVASEFARLVGLAERLRGPGGCPWDAQQTHHSLRRHVLEEAYEVAEAIDDLPSDAPNGDIDIAQYDALEDELGDLLFQVVIQSVLAAEAGAFTVADVARRIHDKLVRRHPHVFGDVQRHRCRRSGHQLGTDQADRDRRRVDRRGRHGRAPVAARGAEVAAEGRRGRVGPGARGARPRRRRSSRARAGHDRGGRQSARHRRGIRARRMGAPIPRSVPTHGGTRARTGHRSRGADAASTQALWNEV